MIMLSSALANRWYEWQRDVVAVLRTDFRDILADIGSEDVDWEAWWSLYEEGRSPRSAVYHALARDLYSDNSVGMNT